ncbi:MAG: lipocalin-like domain-containing protein [Bryobacteraceae bacterium]
MNTVRAGLLVVIFAVSGFSQASSTQVHRQARVSDRERVIGAWQLVSLAAPGSDGKTMSVSHPVGMLTYTRDGHVSVQLMYPASESAISNEYVLNGYEASFGSYEVNEAKHMLIHHIEGANTRDLLVGKNLPRLYEFDAQGNLVIKSARSHEHWSATWKHY